MHQNNDINYKKLLYDIVCVIHRDGGQYIEEHGIVKSVEDAEEYYYCIIAALELLEPNHKLLERNPQ